MASYPMRIVRLSENDYGVYDGLDERGPFKTYLQFRGTRQECERAVALYQGDADYSWRVVRAMTSWPVPADVEAARREQRERDEAFSLLASCAV